MRLSVSTLDCDAKIAVLQFSFPSLFSREMTERTKSQPNIVGDVGDDETVELLAVRSAAARDV